MNNEFKADLATNRRRLLAAPLLAASAATLGPYFANAATTSPPTNRIADSATDMPLGIALEGWPYPGPVKFQPLLAEGQPVRMAYMDFGPSKRPNGRAIFLLHGKNFDSSYWSGPISWLRDAGYRVIVPDQIGFNKSAKPDIDYSFEFLAANTMALADSLGLEQITVLGHSTGGMLAVRIASIYPERIQQLVLEDPIGLVDYRVYIAPQKTEKLVQAERDYTVESYRAFIAHFFPILPPDQYESFVTWRMRITQSAEFERFAKASALTYQMIYRGPVIGLYPTLKQPVLLIAGEADHSVPLAGFATPAARKAMPPIAAAAQTMINVIPNGQLKLFPKAGHVPHLEVPDDFKQVVLSVLK